MAGNERADDGAETVQHPVARARGNALAEATRHEVDDEDHVRHQRHRVEAILDQKRAHGGRGLMGLRVMRRCGIALGLRRPVPPARECEHGGEHAETIPALLQALLKEQRHQRARRGDAKADAGKDHAADDAAPRGRYVRQNDGGRQHHDDSAGEARQKSPGEKPGERHRGGTREEGEGGKQHHRPQRADGADASGQGACGERAGEVTGEVGSAEINDVGCAEPLCGDQRRDQRRVGKAGEAKPDQ